VDVCILGIQLVSAVFITTRGRCDLNDLIDFEQSFQALIRNYTLLDESIDVYDEYMDINAATKLNDIQISVTFKSSFSLSIYLNKEL